MRNLLIGLFLELLISTPAFAAYTNIANAGFETANITTDSFEYRPSIADQGGSGWNFSGNSGIVANSPPTYSNFDMSQAPEGQQTALLQQYYGNGANISSFDQTIMGFTDGSYRVGFYAAGRFFQGSGANPFVVSIDGTALTFDGSTVVTPVVDASSHAFQFYTSDAIPLTAGAHTLSFASAATTSGDYTSFIDAVSVSASAVPEPASWTLFGTGILAALGWVAGARRGVPRKA
jgi:hypothetical protein